MLLNEFLKEHRKVGELNNEISRLKTELTKQGRVFAANTAQQERAIAKLGAQMQELDERLTITNLPDRH